MNKQFKDIKVGEVFKLNGAEYVKQSALEGVAIDHSHVVSFQPTERTLVESTDKSIING